LLKKVDCFFVFLILFFNGWNYGLPVTDMTVPWWATHKQIFHGIYLYEFLFIIYLCFLLIKKKGFFSLPRHKEVRIISFLLMSIGFWGMLSNGVNIQPLKEFGEACRFFLLATFFLMNVNWAKKYGPNFIFRTFLLGIAASGVINLYFSYSFCRMELGGLPFLLGQNGPGGFLGLSVILSALLMLERKSLLDALVAILSCVTGLAAASISYSKLSMIMAGSGLLMWFFVILNSLSIPRTRKWIIAGLCISLIVIFINRGPLINYIQGVKTFIDYKFSSLSDNRSVESRWQYFYIVTEIMAEHPIFGVGYGGFHKAAIQTEAYKSEKSAEEDSEVGEKGESNPHNSFLYYGSANGLLSLVLCVFLFVISMRIFFVTLSLSFISNIQSRFVWFCIVIGYFIYGSTLPTLFNTSVLILPTAAALVVKR